MISPTTHHLRASDYIAKPWKNGGGVTRDVMIFPDHAGLADFDWRISMANVDRDGPFSLFPDIDRTLTLLSGNGMRLDIDGVSHRLTPQSPPCLFSGDANTMGYLLDGPITDLNVMSRRSRFTHQVTRIGMGERMNVAHQAIMIWVDGEGEVITPAGPKKLDRFDALVCTIAGEWRLGDDPTSLAYLISFAPA
jgi:environmental stress-induced protein Ves